MRRMMRILAVVLLAAVSALGCAKANPEDAETQALAKQFIEAVYVQKDADLAMSLVVPFDTYGYVTRKVIDETLSGDAQACTTQADSITVGGLGGSVKIAEVTDADRAKGIEARTGWTVGSAYRCGKDTRDTSRVSVVQLERVNGKWGVSKVSWQTGLGPTNP